MNLTNALLNYPDMTSIHYMAKTKSLSPLLLHPLISCFLHLKWQRLCHILYINFCMFILFTIALIAHIFLRFPKRVDNEPVIITVMLLCFAYILFKLVIIVQKYWLLNDLPHWLDIPMIVVVILSCLEVGSNEEHDRIIASVALLLTALKLTSLIGSLPLPTV